MTDRIGKKVQDFYNKTPFPDYELKNINDNEDLEIAAWSFARILARSIPQGSSVIDVGTGTGQLAAYLSLRRKKVWGIDFSDSSLNKARRLKDKLNLKSLTLKKADVLDKDQLAGIDEKFDYVLCLGVLHHTVSPYEGFENILDLLKPGGYIAVGLYNRSGRFLLKIRQILAKTIFKNNREIKDRFIRMQIGDVEDTERARGWWNDQYLHPHESTHTIGEVLSWFKKKNIEFYGTLPSSQLADQGDVEIAGVWNKTDIKRPSILVRIIKQLSWVWTTHHEGGYWVTFGRKK